MYPVQYVYYTGAGLNLIPEDFLQTEWLDAIEAIGQPSLQSATNQKFVIVGTILLHALIRDARVRAVFEVVRNFVEPLLPETSFIDKFMKGIFTPDHEIMLYNSAPVPIIPTVVRTENWQGQGSQKSDNIEEVAILEDKYESPRLIVVER